MYEPSIITNGKNLVNGKYYYVEEWNKYPNFLETGICVTGDNMIVPLANPNVTVHKNKAGAIRFMELLDDMEITIPERIFDSVIIIP